jgi:hypothetical protein
MAIELNTPLSEEEKQRLAECVRPSVLAQLLQEDLNREQIQEMVFSGRLLCLRNCGPKEIVKICEALGLKYAPRRKRRAKTIPSSVDVSTQLRELRDEPMRLFAGIYFLYWKGELKYIGQSVNVVSRLSQHIGIKSFDSVKTITVREWSLTNLIPQREIIELQSRLLSVEAALINHFKPEWNG